MIVKGANGGTESNGGTNPLLGLSVGVIYIYSSDFRSTILIRKKPPKWSVVSGL
jgi:hypothetical protein